MKLYSRDRKTIFQESVLFATLKVFFLLSMVRENKSFDLFPKGERRLSYKALQGALMINFYRYVRLHFIPYPLYSSNYFCAL